MKRVYVPVCALIALSVFGSAFGAGGVLPGDGLTATTAFQIQDLDDFREFADPANAATYWASGVHTELTVPLNLSGEEYTTAVIAPDTDSSSTDWRGVPYQGFFHGNGFEISNMTIDDKDDCVNNVGLFGRIEGGTVEDLGIVNCTLIIGDDSAATRRPTGYIGALCGNFYGGMVSNCYATGSVQASSHCAASTMSSTSSSVYSLGGLCGSFVGTMSDCYSTCTVNASASDYYSASPHSIGGLCGSIGSSSTVRNSYAIGPVTAEVSRFSGGHASAIYNLNQVAGLCGQNYGTISNCHASGTVQCSADNVSLSDVRNVGGLVGYNNGTIHNSYATGSVSASAVGDSRVAYCHWVGGLAGNNQALIDKSYSVGAVSVSASSNNFTNIYDNGGLCGVLGTGDMITNSFWDTDTSGMTTSAGGAGKTTGEMMTEATFTAAGWDFDASDGSADWVMAGYPQLTWQPVEKVDQEELTTLAQYWQMTGCTSTQPCSAADWYTDGAINMLDLKQLAESWLGADMITAHRADMIDDFETGDLTALEWDDYYTDWSVVSDTVYEGGFSAKSAEITYNQHSYLYMTVDTTGFNRIGFACKVSSEFDDDWLIFYIDGAEQGRWSGEQNWQEHSFPITEGVHTIWWTFADDASGLAGANAAWVDNIRFFNAE